MEFHNRPLPPPRLTLKNLRNYNVSGASHFESIKTNIGFFIAKMNNLVHVTEHFLHTSNEISIILKITIQKYKKKHTQVFIAKMNNSIRVTEHFLHTSNEISIILKITIQKHQKTWGNTTKMNNLVHVTEHFLHTSNGISIFWQKHQKTYGNTMIL